MSVLLLSLGLLLPVSLLLSLAYSCVRWGIPPTPSTGAARRLCLDIMASLPPPRRAVDLGAGFGGMVLTMARALPGAHVVGIEASRWIWAVARLRSAWHPQGGSLSWQRGDFMRADLRSYDGVFCYLYPGAMPTLAAKLYRELPIGAWIVSHAFALPGWQPVRIARAADMWRTPIYVYRVPPRR